MHMMLLVNNIGFVYRGKSERAPFVLEILAACYDTLLGQSSLPLGAFGAVGNCLTLLGRAFRFDIVRTASHPTNTSHPDY